MSSSKKGSQSLKGNLRKRPDESLTRPDSQAKQASSQHPPHYQAEEQMDRDAVVDPTVDDGTEEEDSFEEDDHEAQGELVGSKKRSDSSMRESVDRLESGFSNMRGSVNRLESGFVEMKELMTEWQRNIMATIAQSLGGLNREGPKQSLDMRSDDRPRVVSGEAEIHEEKVISVRKAPLRGSTSVVTKPRQTRSQEVQMDISPKEKFTNKLTGGEVKDSAGSNDGFIRAESSNTGLRKEAAQAVNTSLSSSATPIPNTGRRHAVERDDEHVTLAQRRKRQRVFLREKGLGMNRERAKIPPLDRTNCYKFVREFTKWMEAHIWDADDFPQQFIDALQDSGDHLSMIRAAEHEFESSYTWDEFFSRFLTKFCSGPEISLLTQNYMFLRGKESIRRQRKDESFCDYVERFKGQERELLKLLHVDADTTEYARLQFVMRLLDGADYESREALLKFFHSKKQQVRYGDISDMFIKDIDTLGDTLNEAVYTYPILQHILTAKPKMEQRVEPSREFQRKPKLPHNQKLEGKGQDNQVQEVAATPTETKSSGTAHRVTKNETSTPATGCWTCGADNHQKKSCTLKTQNAAGLALHIAWSQHRLGKMKNDSSGLPSSNSIGLVSPSPDVSTESLPPESDVKQGELRGGKPYLLPLVVNGVEYLGMIDSGCLAGSFIFRKFLPEIETVPAPVRLATVANHHFNCMESTKALLVECGEARFFSSFGVLEGGIDGYDDVAILIGQSMFEDLRISISTGLRLTKPPEGAFDTDKGLERPPSVAIFSDEEQRVVIPESLTEGLRKKIEDNERSAPGLCSHPNAVVRIQIKKGSKPFFAKQYPLPEHAKKDAEETVQRWIAENRVYKLSEGSPWNSPLLPVPKRDADGNYTKTRVVLDLRGVNKLLEPPEVFPLPDIWIMLRQFSECKFFSRIDLQDAYLQLPLHKDDHKILTFTWKGAQWCFSRPIFGLTFMSSLFQRIGSQIFGSIPDVSLYIDDLIIASKTIENHAKAVNAVIDTCTKYGLRVNASKCSLFGTGMEILGRFVTSRGISASRQHVEAVLNWKRPQTGRELQSQLGLANFLRDHVPSYGKYIAPFTRFVNAKHIEWTEELQQHYTALKQALAEGLTLSYPDFNKPFALATDASDTAIGGYLFQPDNPDDPNAVPTNIVMMVSKVLSSSERNYSTYQKELLAVVYALRKAHNFIFGTTVYLHTDHRALVYLANSSKPMTQIVSRWFTVLNDYDIRYIFRPGHANTLADLLSRIPLEQPSLASSSQAGSFTPSSSSSRPQTVAMILRPRRRIDQDTQSPISMPQGGILTHPQEAPTSPFQGGEVKESKDDFMSESKTDTPVIDLPGSDGRDYRCVNANLDVTDEDLVLESKEEESKDERMNEVHEPQAEEPTETHSSIQQLSKTTLPPIVDMSKFTSDDRVKLISEQHSMGHWDVNTTVNRLKEDGYEWPGMRRDVTAVLNNCMPCLRQNVKRHGFHPLRTISAAIPMDWIQVDLKQFEKAFDGNIYALVVVDVATSFVWARAIPNKQSATVAHQLWNIFCDFGMPKIFQSDNGKEFRSKVVLKNLIEICGAWGKHGTPYHSRAQGKVERSIRTISDLIHKMIQGTHREWPMYLPLACHCINSRVRDLTGSSPFALMFGRTSNALKDFSEEKLEGVYEDWEKKIKNLASAVWPSTAERVKLKRAAQAEQFARSHHMVEDLAPGTIVWVKNLVRNNKMESRYQGPYRIVRKEPEGSYIIEDQARVLFNRVPIEYIKPTQGTEQQFEKVFTVEKILKHQGQPKDREYLCRWKGYSQEYDSWEPASNILDQSLIEAYWRRLEEQKETTPKSLPQGGVGVDGSS